MEDLIRREDAIKAVEERLNSPHMQNILQQGAARSIWWALKELPSAEPKRGEWINKHEWSNGFFERECSVCGAMKPQLMHTAKINFCPNCGAKMK